MLKEEKIFIKNDPLTIEALLHKGSSQKGVLVCHPHSLMGGSMYNNVVEAVAEVFAAQNYTTLRFNFRGVGASSGNYDEGNGEAQDIIAAGRHLQELGLSEIYLCGYSFGAWAGAKAIARKDDMFSQCIFISPPDKYFGFDFKALSGKVNLLICGNYDDFCDIHNMKYQSEVMESKLEIIDGADHFYAGREKEIQEILLKYIKFKQKKDI